VKLNETWIEIDSLEYGFPGDSIYKRKRVFSKSDNITLPRFPEGEQAFLQYVRDSVEYPVVSYESGVWGNVQIRFVISETGKVEDTEFIRSIDAAIYKEVRKAMMYISQIDWIPAFKSNEPIRMTVFLTIKFRIRGYGGYE
jgi:protein TonB